LNVDEGIALIELAREHAPELEPGDGLIGRREIALDVAEEQLVGLAPRELEELGRIGQCFL
jgi:hypothetical protein